jgi:hypothetical protein
VLSEASAFDAAVQMLSCSFRLMNAHELDTIPCGMKDGEIDADEC